MSGSRLVGASVSMHDQRHLKVLRAEITIRNYAKSGFVYQLLIIIDITKREESNFSLEFQSQHFTSNN